MAPLPEISPPRAASAAVRVARNLLGTASIEPEEDVVLLTDKKTELLNGTQLSGHKLPLPPRLLSPFAPPP